MHDDKKMEKNNMIILKAKYVNKIQTKITLKLTNFKILNTTIIFFIQNISRDVSRRPSIVLDHYQNSYLYAYSGRSTPGQSGKTTPGYGQMDTHEFPRIVTTITAQNLRKFSGGSPATSGTFVCEARTSLQFSRLRRGKEG